MYTRYMGYVLMMVLTASTLQATETPEDTTSFEDIASLTDMPSAMQRLFIPTLIYQLFLKADPYKNQKVLVRTWEQAPTISTSEAAFLRARDIACHAEVEKIVGHPVALKHTPRIAFLGSGGGMRASVFTAGALKTFSENGLLNTMHYTGGVSGSTWTLLPWQASGKPFNQFYPIFINRVVNGIIPQALTQGVTNILCFAETIAETFLRTFAFLDVPSAIDIYGLLLGLGLLGDGTKVSYANTNLASLIPFVKDGKNPLPLCTALIPSTKDRLMLDVVECTPLEVIDYSSNTAVPAWGCGRTFKDGVSTNVHPPLTLGFLMGIFGSAFTAVTLKEAWPAIISKLWPRELFAPLADLINETKIGDLRVFPAHVRNFSYGINGAENRSKLFNLWVDAGVSINIPIVPFLKQLERSIDIYVICDAGGDVKWSNIISESETYARQNNHSFPHCDSYQARKSTLSVFDDGPQSSAPIVIYLPMIKNSRYSDTFDPQDMMYNNTTGNFLSTDNFIYSKEQAELLAGLASFSASEAKEAIVNAIKTVVERKEKGLRPPLIHGKRIRIGRCSHPERRTAQTRSFQNFMDDMNDTTDTQNSILCVGDDRLDYDASEEE